MKYKLEKSIFIYSTTTRYYRVLRVSILVGKKLWKWFGGSINWPTNTKEQYMQDFDTGRNYSVY